MATNSGRIGRADRAGGLRPEPAAQSQPEALIPCASELFDWSCLLSYARGVLIELDNRGGRGTYTETIALMKQASDAMVAYIPNLRGNRNGSV